MKYIFPEILIGWHGSTLRLQTYLRIKHKDGKFYLWSIIRISPNSDVCIQSFMEDVHFINLFGKIDPDQVDQMGLKVFQLDPDQTEEKERLIKKYPFLK